MGDTPTTDNKAIEIADKIIATANSVGVQLVEALVISQVPFLGLPVIKTLFGWLLSYLDSFISRAEQLGASFVIIDVQIGSEESAIKKAIKGLIAAQKSGDPHAIQLAVKAYADAQSALAHFDGSAHPQ